MPSRRPMKEQIAGAVYAPSVAPSWYWTQAAALIAIVASALAAADLIEFELVEVAHRIGIHIKLSFPCSLRKICKFAVSLQVQKSESGNGVSPFDEALV